MKYVLVIVLVCLGLVGCQSKTASNVTANTQVQADTAAAQQIVQGCLTKGNFLTQAGRQAILACVAPPGHGPQFQACVSGKAGTFKFASKADRDADAQAIAVCLEQNR